MAASKDFTIEQGRTFTCSLRWEAPPIVYKAISTINNSAPARITVPSHNIPPGWRVAVVSVKGMTQINAENTPPECGDYHEATIVDTNTVELNDVNAADFGAYTSGGYLQFNTPVDLAGFTARMTIRNRVGGTELLSLTTENGRISIDNATKKVTLTIPATDTASITWVKGVYDLEMVSGGGVVTAILSGDIAVSKEVTT